MEEQDGGASHDATRVFGEDVPISYADTLAFFEERAERSGGAPTVTVTSYQDHDPDLAHRRDEAEWARVSALLRLERRPVALDVGCGVGRFARHLHPHVERYLGVDFSPGLVALAQTTLDDVGLSERGAVQVGGAAELASMDLLVPPPFGLVVISGVLIYLNDADAERCLASIVDLVASDAVVYVREPVAVTDRLTLNAHWSDELAADYSAVYRSPDFYREAFSSTLVARGFRVTHDDPLDSSLRNRRETSQHFWILDRGPADA